MTPGQRDRVLELLSGSAVPLDAAQIADELGVHVTTARFHLSKLVADGQVETTRLRVAGTGRPRTGYRTLAPAPVGALIGLLLGRLGSTAEARERAAAEAGRVWADRFGRVAHDPDIDLPDPIVVISEALQRLGFRISGVMSAFGTHEIRICSCPLTAVGAEYPEIARGVARGAIEQALAAGSATLASQYAVTVVPDPKGGNCEITLRLAPISRSAPVIQTLFPS